VLASRVLQGGKRAHKGEGRKEGGWTHPSLFNGRTRRERGKGQGPLLPIKERNGREIFFLPCQSQKGGEEARPTRHVDAGARKGKRGEGGKKRKSDSVHLFSIAREAEKEKGCGDDPTIALYVTGKGKKRKEGKGGSFYLPTLYQGGNTICPPEGGSTREGKGRTVFRTHTGEKGRGITF